MYRDIEDQRAANRRYYERNKEIYRAKNRKKRKELQEILREAKSSPCMDCGKSYPSYVMDFDHRDGEDKVRAVAQMIHRGSTQKLLDEIAKCDLVCANCHRIRTHSRLV